MFQGGVKQPKIHLIDLIKFHLSRNSMFVNSNEVGLQGFPPSMLPSHFGSLRLPIGFTSDPHNHFAAFRKLLIL